MDIVKTEGGRATGYLGARCLSRFRAVEDHFALSRDQMVGMLQFFGVNQACSRDLLRRRLDVQHRSQVNEHEGVACVQPPLELHRGDASFS